MTLLNNQFIEEFKRLDKLCGDLYNAKHGVTGYINDMKGTTRSCSYSIANWESDLNQLVRLRNIRNSLVHDVDTFNQELCTQNDIDWIKNFYERILKQGDPIAILHQNSKVKSKTINQPHINSQISTQEVNRLFNLNQAISEKDNKITDYAKPHETDEYERFTAKDIFIICVIAVISVACSIIIAMWGLSYA